MSRVSVIRRPLSRLALLLVATSALVACQFYAPNMPVPRDSTEGIAIAEIERLQQRSGTRVIPPTQLRIATGGLTTREEICRDWLDPCWEQIGIPDTAVVVVEDLPQLPESTRPAPAQTFRGVVPCIGDDPGCVGQQALITLFANQTWRARLTVIDAQGRLKDPIALQGCWQRAIEDPRRLVLRQDNENLLLELQAQSNNHLRVLTESGAENVLRQTLTRQPDVDWLGEDVPRMSACGR